MQKRPLSLGLAVGAVVISVRKYPVRITVRVIILIVPQHPEEREQAHAAKAKGNRDKHCQYIHDLRPSRIAFKDTVIELPDIANAAISGVANPSKAIGTAIRL